MGTAVGLVSLTGYTPDIFAGPAMGWLLDNFPGKTGHQYVFLFTAVFGMIGLIASLKLYTVVKK
jgi:sugar phosphate permease